MFLIFYTNNGTISKVLFSMLKGLLYLIIFNGSKSEKVKGLTKYFNYVEAIRHNNVADKTTLKNLLGVAWPTLQNALEDFECEGSPILSKSGGFFLNNEFSIHAGISVGATQIKLYLCDFGFNPLKQDYFCEKGLSEVYEELKRDDIKLTRDKQIDEGFFCYKREDSIDGIVWRLSRIFECLIAIDKEVLNLLSVGISFPGIIDKDNLRIDFSPNIKCLRNVYIKDLLPTDLWNELKKREIFVSFEHDTQAASIFEKESLYNDSEKEKSRSLAKNICCVYVAAGIGASVIIDNKLCRGSSNSFGEFGHTPSPDLLVEKVKNSMLSEKEFIDKFSYEGEMPQLDEDKNVDDYKIEKRYISTCECGKLACLENAFRRNVFDSYDLDNYLSKINKEHELQEFDKTHPYRYRVLKEYIGYMVGLLINFFNPDMIIFSGRIIWEIKQLQNDLNTIRANSAIGIPASKCDIILGAKKIYSAAAGTAISSYHCCVKNKSFCDICW